MFFSYVSDQLSRLVIRFTENVFGSFSNVVLSAQSSVTDVVSSPGTVNATSAAPPAWTQFVPFLVILVVFYFFLIRPQAKKQKETLGFLSGLKVGDQIVTQSGILGRITNLNDQIVTLEIANNVQIKVLRKLILMSQAALTAKKEGQ